jgi:selenide,water dikinase
MPVPADERVLVGHAGSDDAGVYRISENTALVLTVDFFTPIVDNPFDYGRIAAANSLSDVYAMGGKPFAALNISCFPENKLPAEVLGEILRGGADTAARASCVILGGHTVKDEELKYGLSVVGSVHPDRVVTNAGAKPGDVLILTKPLGSGVLSTALMKNKLDRDAVASLVDVMIRLNDRASEEMLAHNASACTDITGYGLVGHASEMARASHVSIRLDSAALPLIDGAMWAARNGYLTGGGSANRAFIKDEAEIAGGIDENLLHIAYDPQTAGGLLIAVPENEAEGLLSAVLRDCPGAAVVGRCERLEDKLIFIS